jgi:hypothetical protein
MPTNFEHQNPSADHGFRKSVPMAQHGGPRLSTANATQPGTADRKTELLPSAEEIGGRTDDRPKPLDSR